MTPHAQAMWKQESRGLEAVETIETLPDPTKKEEPLKTAENKPKKQTTKKATQKCKSNQWVRKDNGKCINKPQKKVSQSIAGSGSCAREIAKYDWNQSLALAVARAESGLRTNALNNNPATGDYSVGCFQVNIFGANAYTRPSEAQLKNAAVNVRFAYNLYKGNGSSFLGQWGVCRAKVSCY